MAFLSEARQLAEQATRSIEQGLDQVRERIDELQRQRRFNELGRALGLLVYRARRGGTALDEAEVERLCSEMAAIEATLSGGTPGGTSAGPTATGTTRPGDSPSSSGPHASGPPAGPPRGWSLDDVDGPST
jgi:hypothetical protein